MIKTEKDLDTIPASLLTDEESLKNDPAKTTHTRRLELIANKGYIYSKTYDARYKYRDIKDQLHKIYQTCCFCGMPDQQLEVEHYRPKGKYYWLAYSWDNLLLACTKCNKHKSNNFDITGSAVTPKTPMDDLSDINKLSANYDAIECPLLINPDKVNGIELDAFIYHKDGSVTSDDPRVSYTIKTCNLDRKNLREERKTIWDDFMNKVQKRIYEHREDNAAREISIKDLVDDFIHEAHDTKKSCLGFRKYVIKAGWITTFLKELSQ